MLRVEARPTNAKPAVPEKAPLRRDTPEVPTDPQRRQDPIPVSPPPQTPDMPTPTPILIPAGR